MIESLKKTHADFRRALRKRENENAAKIAERLSIMLAQEIVSAFTTVTVPDIPVILAACELAASFITDDAKTIGVADEMVRGATDELVNAANAHTERLTATLPVRKEVDSDD